MLVPPAPGQKMAGTAHTSFLNPILKLGAGAEDRRQLLLHTSVQIKEGSPCQMPSNTSPLKLWSSDHTVHPLGTYKNVVVQTPPRLPIHSLHFIKIPGDLNTQSSLRSTALTDFFLYLSGQSLIIRLPPRRKEGLEVTIPFVSLFSGKQERTNEVEHGCWGPAPRVRHGVSAETERCRTHAPCSQCSPLWLRVQEPVKPAGRRKRWPRQWYF